MWCLDIYLVDQGEVQRWNDNHSVNRSEWSGKMRQPVRGLVARSTVALGDLN